MELTLKGRRILLGICGGIAAYKSAELVRLLSKADASVRVVMSPAARQFITPLTLQALSGSEVHNELFDEAQELAMGHIELARWADCILIAPASANFIARLRAGMANDLLTTLCLASESRIAIAPAMNRVMWHAAATQENVAVLDRRGIECWGPGEGEQACGELGAGRMLEPVELCNRLKQPDAPAQLAGVHVLITAGPTREAIDPVRFIGNRSSGKMGFAMARAAARQGARVTLISGPVTLDTPAGVERINVESAAEMHQAVTEKASSSQLFIAAAAVADYRVELPKAQKIKKSNTDTLQLTLLRNPDILAEVAAMTDGPFTVGFAAETENPEHHATSKLESKQLDMIIANLVGGQHGGFDSNENSTTLIWREGKQEFPMNDKIRLAEEMMQLISRHFHATRNPLRST